MSVERICVAMSGGVDSSVAAQLLKQAGHEVIGVSMQVWDYRGSGGSVSRASCCAPSDFLDARKVAAKLDIPYYVFDFEKHFRDAVIDPFVSSYENGTTPNPCIECNSKVKFRELRRRVESFGFDRIATGHYAQVLHTDTGSRLLRGVDSEKDQSYFLFGLTQGELAKTDFPIGALTKDEVREVARAAGLVTADKPESQDICFVSGSVKEFVERHGVQQRPGTIVSSSGEELGAHDGIHRFTVGQRRGVGVRGSKHPLYILEIDPTENRVVVGPKAELERESFIAGPISWIRPDGVPGELKTSFHARVQLRHRSPAVAATVEPLADGLVRCRFVDQWTTVTPGQACVIYDADNREVLGGGTIQRERTMTALSGAEIPSLQTS
jgi:tRNA-specific 2-thiouridylase